VPKTPVRSAQPFSGIIGKAASGCNITPNTSDKAKELRGFESKLLMP
jgi:hypothetical protein